MFKLRYIFLLKLQINIREVAFFYSVITFFNICTVNVYLSKIKID